MNSQISETAIELPLVARLSAYARKSNSQLLVLYSGALLHHIYYLIIIVERIFRDIEELKNQSINDIPSRRIYEKTLLDVRNFPYCINNVLNAVAKITPHLLDHTQKRHIKFKSFTQHIESFIKNKEVDSDYAKFLINNMKDWYDQNRKVRDDYEHNLLDPGVWFDNENTKIFICEPRKTGLAQHLSNEIYENIEDYMSLNCKKLFEFLGYYENHFIIERDPGMESISSEIVCSVEYTSIL